MESIIDDNNNNNNNSSNEGNGNEEEEYGKEIAEIWEPKEASSEEEGEDLLGEGMMKDYRKDPFLDKYDETMLDKTSYPRMSAFERIEAEREISMRRSVEKNKDRNRKLKDHFDERFGEKKGRSVGKRRIPRALESDAGDSDADLLAGLTLPRRAVDFDDYDELNLGDLVEDAEEVIDISQYSGDLKDWLALESTAREVARLFKTFLTHSENRKHLYVIRKMVIDNGESFLVNYLDLYSYGHVVKQGGNEAILSIWLVEEPFRMLQIFDAVATSLVMQLYPEYHIVSTEIHVRIENTPLADTLRDLRQWHLNTLVTVSGVITHRSKVYPQLRKVCYDCSACKSILGPYSVESQGNTSGVAILGSCPDCMSRGPFTVNTRSTQYRNYQKISLQESPGTVPPGRLPRTKEVLALGDLIDFARPGEEVVVIGIYRHNYDYNLNINSSFPVFSTLIEANSIVKKEDKLAAFQLSEQDEHKIREMAKDDRIGEKIINSIAPSIYGHRQIKTAIALMLFGGVPKYLESKHRIRGDINILLLGDPGTAKSQFLKYVEKTAHRAVYTTGKGASAVGLTAAVLKDPVTHEWALEGGALVLADQGVCLIDEFDKMNDVDRTSIHEAMEQQTISISKAGIVTTLHARCAVLAAANPIRGRYDCSVSLMNNVDLTEPILSRFDVLCTVRDIVNPVTDEQLARFVVESHQVSHPSHEKIPSDETELFLEDDSLSQEDLKKYLIYAKQRVRPQISYIDQEKIQSLYHELRQESAKGGCVPVNVRVLEAIVRMAEAHAKMHLRDHVKEEDVNIAISVILESFIFSQKYSVSNYLRNRFQKYITHQQNWNEILLHLLMTFVTESRTYHKLRHPNEPLPKTVSIPLEDFQAKAAEAEISDLRSFFRSRHLKRNNFHLERNIIIWTAQS